MDKQIQTLVHIYSPVLCLLVFRPFQCDHHLCLSLGSAVSVPLSVSGSCGVRPTICVLSLGCQLHSLPPIPTYSDTNWHRERHVTAFLQNNLVLTHWVQGAAYAPKVLIFRAPTGLAGVKRRGALRERGKHFWRMSSIG